MSLQPVNTSAIEALLFAASEAEKSREPSLAEIFDPYRTAIQESLDKGLSVQKILDILTAHGVGKEKTFSAVSFQKYISTSGYVKKRGKFAGMSKEAKARVKKELRREEALSKPIGELFDKGKSDDSPPPPSKVRNMLGARATEDRSEPPLAPRVANEKL